MAPDAAVNWLLTADERGNPATAIDAEHADRRAWTSGNHVTAHVDGAAYFARLHQLLSELGAGDWVYLTDWRIDATRQLAGPGSELGPLLARLVRRGVAIRGLVWRSHPALIRFNQDANRVMSTLVNRPGGLGDGARVFARQLRLRLWREHLGFALKGGGDAQLVDPVAGFELWRATAARLQAWHDGGKRGPRPSGRIRPHQVVLAPALKARWAAALYRVAIDPDGRPLPLRRDTSL